MANELDKTLTPNLGFKLGLQSTVDTMLGQGTSAGAIHGTFYLTQDTHRLYIGNSDGSLSPVNQGIISVASLNDLPNTGQPGQFYYISASSGEGANVLCVYSGGHWVQVNTVVKLKSFTNTVTASNNVATITHNVQDTAQTNPDQFRSQVTITGTSGLTVTAADHNITLTGNKASAALALDSTDTSNKTANITLSNSNATDSSVIGLVAGTNMSLSVANGKVTFSSVDNKVSSAAFSNAENNGNGFVLTVHNSEGQNATASFDPTITYGGSGNQIEHFKNGTVTLSVYTKTEVDDKITEKLRDFNAMEYKGTVLDSVTPNFPTASDHLKIGYTYLLASSYTDTSVTPNVTYPAGTMIIANGTEGTDGYITAASLSWDMVDATGTDTTYKCESVTHGLAIKNAKSNATIGSIQLTAASGSGITLTDTTGTGTNSIAVAHASVTRSDTTGTAQTIQAAAGTTVIPIVTGVTTDTMGHITGVEVTNYSLVRAYSTLANDTVTTATATSSGVTTATVTMTHKIKAPNNAESTATGAFGIQSSSLAVAANGSAVALNLVWGAF